MKLRVGKEVVTVFLGRGVLLANSVVDARAGRSQRGFKEPAKIRFG